MVGCNNVEIRTPNHHYQYVYEIPSGEMLILVDLIEALEKCFSEKLNWPALIRFVSFPKVNCRRSASKNMKIVGMKRIVFI